VSRAPLASIESYKTGMGWVLPWLSSSESDFNVDFGLSRDDGETFGLSVFLRDGDNVYRTYFVAGRGVEALGSVWTFLDLTPLGRQGRPGKTHPRGTRRPRPTSGGAATTSTRDQVCAWARLSSYFLAIASRSSRYFEISFLASSASSVSPVS
jgi:hypothetical protein